MIDKGELWTLTVEAMRAFVPFYQEAMGKAIEESGFQNWFFLMTVLSAEPEPCLVQRII